MKCVTLLVAVFTLSCCVGTLNAALTPEEENWKMIQSYTRDNVVTTIVGIEEFQRKVMRSPRNFTLLIEVLGRSNCILCPSFDESFSQIAASYHRLKSLPNFPKTIHRNSSAPLPQPLIFLRAFVDDSDNWGLVQKFQLTHLPAIVRIPGLKKSFPVKSHYPFSDRKDVEAARIRDWIHENTRAHIPLPGDSVREIVDALPTVFLGLLLLVALYYIRTIFNLRRSKWFWFFVPVMAVYWTSNSGFVGNLINTPPPYQYIFRSDSYAWIYPSPMMQFLYEGYVASTLLLVSSLSFISMMHFPEKIRHPVWQRLSVLFLLALSVFCINLWMEMYCKKNSGYPFQFYHPVLHHFVKPSA